jgi:hypothetical protein
MACGFRAEGEQYSERSGAGISIVRLTCLSILNESGPRLLKYAKRYNRPATAMHLMGKNQSKYEP